jgi:hypothetical protein
MKTKTLFAILLGFALSLFHETATAASPAAFGGDPDVKVVVSQKRIWLVADEISVKNLTVQVKNEQGRIVLEKQFSSKMADWSLNIESLPKGKYSVTVGKTAKTQFTR